MYTIGLILLLSGFPGCRAPAARPSGPVLQVTRVAPAPVIRQASGIGYPPASKKGAQARLMARRAAEVLAVANLQADMARAGERFRGFRYKSANYRADGSVEVVVEAPARAR